MKNDEPTGEEAFTSAISIGTGCFFVAMIVVFVVFMTFVGFAVYTSHKETENAMENGYEQAIDDETGKPIWVKSKEEEENE